MKVAITGATGFIGRALCNELIKGHNVIALTRNPEKASSLLDKAVEIFKWNPDTLDGWEKCLEGSDAVVNLAGTNLALGRWTKNVKAEILNSRVSSSRLLVSAMKSFKARPKVIILASAIGFYGSRGDELLDEDSKAGYGFLAKVCQEIESYYREFEALGFRSVIIRTGVVLGANGGALPKMMMPFKFYIGGHWGSGNQWMSWISLADEVAAIKFLIENANLCGVFNLTSLGALKNRQFFQILAGVLKKTCWLPMPAFALKVMFGQMASELFLASQRVYPRKLIDSGFKFEQAELINALESMDI